MNRVLPHEVAQAVKGSNDTRFYGVRSGDVGKELPRTKSVVCVFLLGERPHNTQQGTFPACMFVPGIYTLGSTIVVRGALHTVLNRI